MATETLTYEFDDDGLDDLRSDMEALAEDTEDVGDTADDTASDLEDLGDTDAAGDIPGNMEDAQQSVEDLGIEAEQVAEQMEDAFREASKDTSAELTGLSDQLEGLEDVAGDIDIGGQISGGGGVGSLISQTLGSGAGVAGAMQLSSVDLSGVESLEDALAGVQTRALELEMSLDEVDAESLEAVSEGAQEAAGDLSDAADRAGELGDSIDDGPKKMGNVAGEGADEFSDLSDEIDVTTASVTSLGGAWTAAKAALAGYLSTAATATTAGAALAVGGGLFAAKKITDFTREIGRAEEQLTNARAATGATVDELRAMQDLSGQLGLSTDFQQIARLLERIQRSAGEATEEGGEAAQAFRDAGISMQALEQASPVEMLTELVRGTRDATAAQRALIFEQIAGGRAARDLAAFTQLSTEELREFEQATQDSTGITETQRQALQDVSRRWAAMGQEIDKTKRSLGADWVPLVSTSVIPLLETLNDKATDWVDSMSSGLVSLIAQTTEFQSLLAALNAMGVFDQEYTVQMGEDESVQFASDIPAAERAREQFTSQRSNLQDDFDRGLIDEQEFQRRLVSLRRTLFEQLRQANQNNPQIDISVAVDSAAQQLRKAQQKLQAMAEDGDITIDLELEEADEIPSAGEVASDSLEQNIQQGSLQGLGGGLSALQDAAKSAGSIEEINSLIKSTRDSFDTVNNQEARDFIGRLQKMREEMKKNQKEAELIGDAMARSIARSADRVFDSIGQAFTDAIFGSGGPGEAQSKLDLFNAKEQTRSLREALREGEVSYRKFSLQMQAQQSKIQKKQEQLNKAMESGFAKAADSMLQAFKQVAKQLVAEITAVVAKMAVLKAITTALDIGSGGFAGSVISNLGGAAFLDSGKSGGMVKSSGLAEIHEDEQIMTAETVSALEGLLQPATPSVQPAAMGGNMNINVEVQGETRTDGRDLKTSYDTTTRIERRKGRA